MTRQDDIESEIMTHAEDCTLGRPTTRPDLTQRIVDLPPGTWWSPDGHLHIEVQCVGEAAAPSSNGGLPEGWVWVIGDLYMDGRPVDVCTVPVYLDALPPER